MLHRFALVFFFSALTAIPALARAAETQWEVIRVYALGGGGTLAVGLPSEWEPVGETRDLQKSSTLRFLDEAGNRVEIPVAALVRASGEKRVVKSEEARKLSRKVRNWS